MLEYSGPAMVGKLGFWGAIVLAAIDCAPMIMSRHLDFRGMGWQSVVCFTSLVCCCVQRRLGKGGRGRRSEGSIGGMHFVRGAVAVLLQC